MQVTRNAVTFEDHYPSLDGYHLDHIDIPNAQLAGLMRDNDLSNARFNGCLYRHNGRNLLLYRCYSNLTQGRGNLAISELSSDYQTVLSNKELNLSQYGSMRQYEDGRFFEHNGELYIAYVVVDYAAKYWAAMRVTKLDEDFNEVMSWMPDYNGNGRIAAQKNWVFFSDGEHIKAIYSIPDSHILIFDDGFNVIGESRNKFSLAKAWGYGYVRGGTPPLDMGAYYLAFFHSSTSHPQRIRRYSMTPYAFAKTGDHAILACAREPIVFASSQNPICHPSSTWWHPIVVFPMGIVDDGESISVSCGVNDLYNAVIRFPRTDLLDKLEPISTFRNFAPTQWFIDGTLSVKGATWINGYAGSMGTCGVFSVETPKAMAELVEQRHKIYRQ